MTIASTRGSPGRIAPRRRLSSWKLRLPITSPPGANPSIQCGPGISRRRNPTVP